MVRILIVDCPFQLANVAVAITIVT